MTTTRVYRWDDTSAPVLTGQTGAWKAIVKMCLYGNGSGVAYGSGGAQKLAAGWSLPFTDTSTKLVVRNSLAAGGSGAYVRVLDDGSGAASFREAYTRTYGAMTDIDTGTDATPTTAQMTNGAVIRKSATADSTVRKWIIVADELTFYAWIESSSSAASENSIYGGGDFDDFVPSSGYRFFCMARNTENTVNGSCGGMLCRSTDLSTTPSGNQLGLWLARGYALTGTAVPASLASIGLSNAATIGSSSTGIADPAPGIGGRVYLPALIVNESTVRGRLRGLFTPLNNLSGVTGGALDTAPAGRPVGSVLTIFRAQSVGTGGTSIGALAAETAASF